MYLKHVRLYKRHSNLKRSKRRLTLNHFDALFQCNAFIVKMARLRFPGRPGLRTGKTYVKYVHDDVKMNAESCSLVYNKIEVGLKLFYELFGNSDEEEEFEGFTKADLVEAEAALARKLKTKEAVERYLDLNQDLSSSAASDVEKFLSSDSEAPSSSSMRHRKGMRDSLRKSYDKIVKHGLDKKINSIHGKKSTRSSNLKTIVENEETDYPNISNKKDHNVNKIKEPQCVDISCKYVKSAEIVPKRQSGRKYFVKQLINKTSKLKAQHRGRRKSLRPNVKKKYKKHFLYSNSKKYPKSIQKIITSKNQRQFSQRSSRRSWTRNKDVPDSVKSKSEVDSVSKSPSKQTVLMKSKLSFRGEKAVSSVSSQSTKSDAKVDSCSSQSAGKDTLPKRKRPLSRKRFILPPMSARSCRKIIPRRRYIDESEQLQTKVTNEDSQGSLSSISGSSEAISAMDGESSPDDTQSTVNSQKVGLLDRPLVVEGKRPWKPSLKVQMKLSEMNCDYPFALKKNMDGSSGTSSGSFKDIIKPDMVSKYAEKMAQKAKEKPPKVIECTKKFSVPEESEEDGENECSDASEGNKKGDKLEKVAAKIEKLLKSQWEGRIKNSKSQPPKNLCNSEIVTQWKSEQQQRNCNQRRTKSILRKARLQLKKRNSTLRTRQSVKQASLDDTLAEDVDAKLLKVKSASNLLVISNDVEKNFKNPSLSTKDTLLPVVDCVICDSSQVYHLSKSYTEVTCVPCHKFLESFLKTPKQYFCKDGNCPLDGKSSTPRRPTNSRCKACWLKACIEKLSVPSSVKDELMKNAPKYDTPPHNTLLAVEENDDDVPLKGDVINRGPRIKHVCRRAAVVLGLPRATFADISEDSFYLSALPVEEKQRILENVPPQIETENTIPKSEAKSSSPSKLPKQSPKKKTHKSMKSKNKIHLDLLKKSALLICNDQKKRKLQLKKSTKHLHKRSVKKCLKLGKKNQMKKIVKYSYKTAVKTSMKTSPKVIQQHLGARPTKFRKVRCRKCEGCLAEDCGQCPYCLDKKKFGGPNLIKQACMHRRCLKPTAPSLRRTPKMSFSVHMDKSKSYDGRSGFGGDGPSGIGTSLTSSSSSPSSPEGSSCGSSCTSSSSSSSSGSSNSSSSSSSNSSSSSSSTSSSSNQVSASNSLLISNSVTSSLMPNLESQSVILHQPQCVDNNIAIFPDSVYTPEPTLHDLLSQKAIYGDGILECGNYKDTADTILYDESSSIIELKNASYTPSLLYAAALGDESGSYSSSSSSKYAGSQGRTYKKSQFVDKDQYGSAGSGSNGDDNEEDDEDDDENKKHFVLADYWEDYDFERVYSQGFALVSSQQIPLPCVCYLCGSAGQEKLIFCVLCCEPYHTFCLQEEDVPSEENIDNWCCKRCQSCAVCGSKNNLLKCKTCQDTYHGECLAPHYPTKPSRRKRIWVCPKCVKCKSCGMTTSSLNSGHLWNFDLLLCHACSKLTDKGNFCPVCRKCYEENDYESKMVQCNRCYRWVHAACDGITDESYEILSCLPETVVYTCISCARNPLPTWRLAISDYRTSKLKSAMNTLLYSKCARYLVKQDSTSKNSSYLSVQNVDNNSATHEHKLPISPELPISDTKDKTMISVECDVDVKNVVSDLVSNFDTGNNNSLSQAECAVKQTNCIAGVISDLLSSELVDNRLTCPELIEIRSKLDKGHFDCIFSFFEEVEKSLDNARTDENKLHIIEAKKIIIKELKKNFPFFTPPETKVCSLDNENFPKGMLQNAALPPSEDHIYAQYLERIPIVIPESDIEPDTTCDIRACVLCGYTGDSSPQKCGRLLYCGQDDWVHVNCALWSAEVFEQQDGSLRNVYPAIARGKLMHCEFCNQLGATVGCCVRGCPANYHFYCARKDEAFLQEDKKVFCALHKDHVDAKIMKEDDFIISKKMFVHQKSLSPKWLKEDWGAAKDVQDLTVQIGSLTVHKLGHLVPLSDTGKILIPVDYECTRIFWSTKNPKLRVKYTCRIKEVRTDDLQNVDINANETIIHANEQHYLKSESDKQKDSSFKDSSFIGASDISTDIADEVIKVIQKLIKKVIKSQKKCWKKMKKKLADFKGADSEKNTLFQEYKKCEAKILLNMLDSKNVFDKNNEKVKKFEPHTKTGELNSPSKSSRKTCDNAKNSFIYSTNHSGKNSDQSKTSYPEMFRKYIQRTELKRLKKKLKCYSLGDKNFKDLEKVMDVISNKEASKDLLERLISCYKDIGDMPPKVVSLLDSVLPPCSVRETVLPIFVENSAVNESSGYSSNDDAHIRAPAVLNSVPVAPKSTDVSKLRSLEDIKLNGQRTFSQNVSAKSNTNNRELGNSGSAIRDIDGISQSIGPYKCTKCKRIYRTSESYHVHVETCNFVVDSTSTEDDSSDSSSDGSDETSDSSSDELNSRDLNRYPLKKSTNSSENCLKENNNIAAKSTPTKNQNITSGNNDKQETVTPRDLNSIPLSKKPAEANKSPASPKTLPDKKVRSPRPLNTSHLYSRYRNSSLNRTTRDPYASPISNNKQSSPITKSNYNQSPVTKSNYDQSPIIEITSPMPPQNIIQNVPLNISNVSMNTQMIQNSYNIGFGNTICNEVPSSIVQLPCNTVILPPAPEPLPPTNSLIQLPSNNFYNASIDINQASQISYVGSLQITNSDAMPLATINMPDQMIPLFPQASLNFGQSTLLPNQLQIQQPSGFQFSSINMQQITVQGAFSSGTINPFVFPQQTLNVPQGQVMFIEEPIMSSNAHSQNYIYQVPVAQPSNAFTSFVPQPQQQQQQFVSPVTFTSSMQSNQNIMNNLVQDQSNQQEQQVLEQPQEQSALQQLESMPILMPEVSSTTPEQNISNSVRFPSSVISPSNSPKCLVSSTMSSSSSRATTPSVSNCSTPVPDSSSCLQQIKFQPDSHILDILKKAAEQMLSMSDAKRKAQSQGKVESEQPEKKTRFAHTRKVAARRAEKLRLMNNNPLPLPKPKTVKFNITTLKSPFQRPVLPAPVSDQSLSDASDCSNIAPAEVSAQSPTPPPPPPPVDHPPQPVVLPEPDLGANERYLRNNCRVVSYKEEESEEEYQSDEEDSILFRIQKHTTKNPAEDGRNTPHIVYEISSEDGFSVQAYSVRDAWEKIYDALQDSRIANYMKQIPVTPDKIDGIHMLGLNNSSLIYLVEQLPGAEHCKYYDFVFHKPTIEVDEVRENITGCARSEQFNGRREYDMFNFLASEHRLRPVFVPPDEDDEGSQKSSRRVLPQDLPIAMRFRNLKTVARETVGVYRSSIHGRGLFCKRNVDAGELVIEYAGEVIRSVLTDQREMMYQSKGIGCYMFRIDDDEVVDATMHGNAARFINHSCEPNCFSKVITVDSKKHIVIFALRRISVGEELTYDYKFPFEEVKIPCHCNSRKCRKYLN